MTYTYYLFISRRGEDIVVSQPYPQCIGMGTLCDKARNLSLEYECETTIYQCFIMNPTSTKALYRFNKGLLVRV